MLVKPSKLVGWLDQRICQPTSLGENAVLFATFPRIAGEGSGVHSCLVTLTKAPTDRGHNNMGSNTKHVEVN